MTTSDNLLEAGRPRPNGPDEIGSPPLDTQRMELVIGDCGEDLRRRQESQPERSRRRFPPAGDDAAVGATGFDSHHLLLENGRNERLQDRPRPADPKTSKPSIELADESAPGLEVGAVIYEAGERRGTFERRFGPLPPGLHAELSAGDDELDRRRAVGRSRGSEGPAGSEPHRRVAGPSNQWSQRQPKVERGVETEGTRGHRCQSVTRMRDSPARPGSAEIGCPC